MSKPTPDEMRRWNLREEDAPEIMVVGPLPDGSYHIYAFEKGSDEGRRVAKHPRNDEKRLSAAYRRSRKFKQRSKV